MKERIVEILSLATLEAEDRKMLEEHLAGANEAAQRFFIEMFQNDHVLLPLVVDNLKKKIAAGSDPLKVEEIIQEEARTVTELTKNP